jgi:hypothetical protein
MPQTKSESAAAAVEAARHEPVADQLEKTRCPVLASSKADNGILTAWK